MRPGRLALGFSSGGKPETGWGSFWGGTSQGLHREGTKVFHRESVGSHIRRGVKGPDLSPYQG